MYLYVDENDYVYGYGSENEPGSVPWQAVLPDDVSRYLGCYRFNNGDFLLDENRKEFLINKEMAESEYNGLNAWFIWYDQQCAQYNRCLRLGIEFNKDMTELDTQAAENQARMAELKNIMFSVYTE